MHSAKWIIAVFCLVQAVWLSAFNWNVFWKRHVRNVRAPSWVPLVGGGLGAIGLATLPVAGSSVWWWLPLLLDWGCVPGIGYTIFYHLTRQGSR